VPLSARLAAVARRKLSSSKEKDGAGPVRRTAFWSTSTGEVGSIGLKPARAQAALRARRNEVGESGRATYVLLPLRLCPEEEPAAAGAALPPNAPVSCRRW
jgi:hypothetical protein